MSRSGFYKWLTSFSEQKDLDLVRILEFEFHRLGGIYGYRRMQMLLKHKYNLLVNHKKLHRVMKEYGLTALIRRKKTNNMYHRNKESLLSPNLLDRDFTAVRPGEKYVTDITFIPYPNGMAYLSPIMDLFNAEVVEYKLSRSQDASLSTDVVKALDKRRGLKGAIIHSDQGVHYTSHAFTALLKDSGAIQSMSRKANCWDNAMMENFFSHFKSECIRIRKKALRTFQDITEVVNEYIRFYNTERMQKKLREMPPIAYREHFSHNC